VLILLIFLFRAGKGEICEDPEGQAGEPVAGAEEADPD
jgi:hypothetical protein